MIEAAELSSSRREVAVKTTCGHVIGKSEGGAYVFKVSTKESIIINGSKIKRKDVTVLKKVFLNFSWIIANCLKAIFITFQQNILLDNFRNKKRITTSVSTLF